MQPLILYFNELSIPSQDTMPSDLLTWMSTLLAGLKVVGQSQKEYSLAFQRGQWHAIYSNKPLSLWLMEGMKRDQYRSLLAKVKIRDTNQQNDLLRQVYFQGIPTTGLTFARVADSWVFSFPKSESLWSTPSIAAVEYRYDDDNISSEDCDIPNIGNEQHALHWQIKMHDWGREVANNNTIGSISGYPVEMYPIDHGFPHIHLIDAQRYKTLAKFRIDKFDRMEGPPQWDTEARVWVSRNKDELLRSWERCQRGEHPYRITEDDI